ncbi:MAG: hypothetical protein AB8C95_11615 [Phycisphaeraceae bacterium]
MPTGQKHPHGTPPNESKTMVKLVFLPLSIVALCIASVAGYQWAKANVAQDIYRDRLTSLQADYQDLAEQYNQAITPRPVTELFVEDGKVCVIVRKGDGELVRVPTPFNGWENDVYVDYVLADGRLLIRRVFEIKDGQDTSKPVQVDSDLVDVQWGEAVPFGKAIYRSKMEDGRWVVSVTGDGSLTLKRVGDEVEVNLATQPRVEKFSPVDQRADEAVEQIGVGDVWKHLMD